MRGRDGTGGGEQRRGMLKRKGSGSGVGGMVKVESCALTGRSPSWRSGRLEWWLSGTPPPGSAGSPPAHSLYRTSLRPLGRHCCRASWTACWPLWNCCCRHFPSRAPLSPGAWGCRWPSAAPARPSPGKAQRWTAWGRSWTPCGWGKAGRADPLRTLISRDGNKLVRANISFWICYTI